MVSLKVKRAPKREILDRAKILEVFRAGYFATVAIAEGEQPVAIPMAYVIDGEHVYIHGSIASRLMRHIADGAPVCLSVTLLDGLVMARSVFNHSMNYRSACLFGSATVVKDETEKLRVLEVLTERYGEGRWQQARQPDAGELKATMVLRFDTDKVSAKIRSGPPEDDDRDLDRDCWAGVIPFELQQGTPIPDG